MTRSQSNLAHRPIMNSLPYSGLYGRSILGATNNTYQRFWKWFKSSPELIGTINLLTTDIIGDRPKFTDMEGKPLGRNKRQQAEKFWKGNRVKETIKAILYDMFVTGDGYGWIGKLSQQQRIDIVKEAMGKIYPRLSIKEKSQFNRLAIKAAQDEDLKTPKKFDYIASSTVSIDATEQEIKKYIQNVRGRSVVFNPPEIIHFRLMTMDGMYNGFSPIEGLAAEIALLRLIDKNMIAYLENGGSPEKMYILPDEIANSTNHQFLVQTLQKYKMIQNRHGNLVFTGNVNVEDLSGNPKDLEFKELALYILSKVAWAFNIPVTRMPFLIGSSATSGDSGGMAESGYWNMISEKQDMIEDLLNLQLFEPFGIMIELNRKYKQDEVREAQTDSMNADTVTKYQDIYSKQNKKLTVDSINRLLNFNNEDLEEIPEKELMSQEQSTGMMNRNLMEQSTGMMNRNLMADKDIQKEPDNRKRANTKRDVVNSDDARIASV